jgi:hypothetical protein
MRKATRERGQALIELVLVVPLIMVLILAVLDVAMVVDSRGSIDHAVREGTRAAAAGDSASQVVQHAVDESDGLLEAGDVSVCYEDIDGNGAAGDVGDNVQVKVSHTHEFVLGGELLELWGVSPPSITLEPTGQERLEQSVTGVSLC